MRFSSSLLKNIEMKTTYRSSLQSAEEEENPTPVADAADTAKTAYDTSIWPKAPSMEAEDAAKRMAADAIHHAQTFHSQR